MGSTGLEALSWNCNPVQHSVPRFDWAKVLLPLQGYGRLLGGAPLLFFAVNFLSPRLGDSVAHVS